MSKNYYTTEQLSGKKSLTPEGYLIIKDVAVSKTGIQDYHRIEIDDSEIPGTNPIITAIRKADEVFADTSLASFVGKSITIDHPREGVDANNYRSYEVGTVLSAHADLEAGVVRADFLIKDATTVDWLKDSNTQVSVGYDAEYVPVGANTVEQRGIVVNHVALVDAGRCGALCVTKDHSMEVSLHKETVMEKLTTEISKVVKKFIGDSEVTDAKKDEVPAEMKDEAETATFDAESAFAVMQKQLDAIMKALPKTEDGGLVEWAKEEEEEEEHSDLTGDAETESPEEEAEEGDLEEDKDDASANVADADEDCNDEEEEAKIKDSIEQFRAQAAIVAPGYEPKTMDSATKQTFADALCACQRAALGVASEGKNKESVRAILKDRNLEALDATATSILFDAVAGAITAINNSKLVVDGVTATGNSGKMDPYRAWRIANGIEKA